MNAQLRLTVGRLTDRGMVRERNEDFVGGPEGIPLEKLEQKGWLYVVADGMGGHLGGERAARLAVERVIREYYRDPSLDIPGSMDRAIQIANAEIYNEATRNPAHKGMGSTIVAAVVRGGDLYVANVGDSRAYLIRGPSIQQITRDHSLIADKLRAGIITPEQALTDPDRSVITRSLGGKPSVQVDHFQRKIHPGDIILLCSDGLTNVMPDANIHAVVSNESPRKAAESLVAMANQAGGLDNIAAVVIGVQRALAPVPVRPKTSLVPILGGIAALALVLAVMFGLRPPSVGPGAPPPLSPTPTEEPLKEGTTVVETPTPAIPPSSPTSTVAPTSTPAVTPEPVPATTVPVVVPASTETPTPTPTFTLTPPPTQPSAPTPTDTPTPVPPTSTPTNIPTPTSRPPVTPTPTPTPTLPPPTPTPTATPVPPTPTDTPTPVPPTPTSTPIPPTPTATLVPPTPTNTPTTPPSSDTGR